MLPQKTSRGARHQMTFKQFKRRFKYKRILYIRKDGEGTKRWYWSRSDGFTAFPEDAKVFDTFHDSEMVRRPLMREKVFVALDPVPMRTIRKLYENQKA